jgi:hypothetical protein
VLRNCRPDRQADFNRWIIYVWCRREEDLAKHGYRLLDIYAQLKSFLGTAEEETRHIRRAIENAQDRQKIYRGIRQALGAPAAQELEGVWEGSREPFNKLQTRDVTKATDALFSEALSTIPAIAPDTIMTAYRDLGGKWASQALYYGTPTQIREIVSYNLGLLARRADFDRFIINTGEASSGDAPYAQANALYERTIAGRGTFIGIRLWRSPVGIFVCGNANFEGPQEAVCKANSLLGVQPGVDITRFMLGDKDSLLRGVKKEKRGLLEDLVRQRVVRLQRLFADEVPPSQWDVLFRPDILSFTLDSIACQIPLSVQDATHTHRGQQFPGAIVVVSVVPTLRPSHAMTYFPGGYLDTLISLMDAYQFNPKGPSPFIHWIYCFDSHTDAHRIHLSIHFPRSLGIQAQLVAQDLLSKEEKRRFQDSAEDLTDLGEEPMSLCDICNEPLQPGDGYLLHGKLVAKANHMSDAIRRMSALPPMVNQLAKQRQLGSLQNLYQSPQRPPHTRALVVSGVIILLFFSLLDLAQQNSAEAAACFMGGIVFLSVCLFGYSSYRNKH